MPAFWGHLFLKPPHLRTICCPKKHHKIKPPRSDVSASGFPSSTGKAGGGTAARVHPLVSGRRASRTRAQPLAPTPTRGLCCGHAAPGSRSGAGGDTNLTPQSSGTEARGSLRSADAALEPVPDLPPQGPHHEAHGLSAAHLSQTPAVQERSGELEEDIRKRRAGPA